ncbi:hypothetical protein TA3x_003924 [Tundrisphaera sp. TA3]|uniref:hypothetical protein n=1 Tax=Tundrisphaera sp. TA3 TaxID=3435775 RepID=UPI003EB8F608
MRRFSTRSLMGLILAVAMACLATRRAGDLGLGRLLMIKPLADVLLTATTLLLALAIIGGLFGKDAPRAGRLGFVAFGGGYFALAFLVLTEAGLARLPTSRLLLYAHQQAAPTRTVKSTVSYYVPARANRGNSFLNPEPPGLRTRTVIKTVPNPSSPLWGSLLPGAADHESFRVVGHCLFALAAGWAGAIASRRIWARPGSRSSPPTWIGDLDQATTAQPSPRFAPR